MDEITTNTQFHSIFKASLERFVAEIMHRTQHSSRIAAACLVILAMCSISPAVMAWNGDIKKTWVGTTIDGKECWGTKITYGPFDYLQRADFPGELAVVEDNHFDEGVESLKKGMSTSPIGDIDYTLRAWPNHHRALNSALSTVRYSIGCKTWGTGLKSLPLQQNAGFKEPFSCTRTILNLTSCSLFCYIRQSCTSRHLRPIKQRHAYYLMT